MKQKEIRSLKETLETMMSRQVNKGETLNQNDDAETAYLAV